jgi:hypothetical protein
MATAYKVKPSGVTCMVSADNSDNLQGGGNHDEKNRKRYYFNKEAYNRLVYWLLVGNRFQRCVHFVLTIPSDEFWKYQYISNEQEREKYWQKRVKLFLEKLRRLNYLGEYSWFKERNKQGVLHWHVIHDGRVPPSWTSKPKKDKNGGIVKDTLGRQINVAKDFSDLNALWSGHLRKHRSSPHYKNALTSDNKSVCLKGSPHDAATYFAKYFHKGKQDAFYSKAYRIGTLPEELAKTSLNISYHEFIKVAGSKVLHDMDYSRTFAVDLNQLSEIINNRLELWNY